MVVARPVDAEHVMAVGRAVGLVGAGDAAMVERTAPPRAGDGGEHVVVVRVRVGAAVGGAEIMVLGRVGVPGEADAGPIADEPEQVACIRRVGGGHLGIEIGAQRDVHREDQQRLRRRHRQQVAHEGELVVREAADVGAVLVAGLAAAGAEIIDVVEHDEQRAAVRMRVVRSAEHALPGVARAGGIGGLVVEVVIAADRPPRHADAPDHAVEAGIDGEVVEGEVAQRHAEGGAGAQQRHHRLVADVLDLRRGFGLRVGEEDHVEALGLGLAREHDIDRGRQRAGRRQAAVAKAERGGRAFGIVDVGQPGQVGRRVHRRGETRGLDHEEGLPRCDRETPAACGIGAHDVAAVGDEHAGEPAAAGFRDDAGGLGRRVSRRDPGGTRRERRRRAADHHVAAGWMLDHGCSSSLPKHRNANGA